MMATIVWTVFAVAAMFAIFGTCAMIVMIGVRMLENVLAKRRSKPLA